jgi:hypothetical protein
MSQELRAYCINLDSRPDKWKETKAAFSGSGIDLQRFSGVVSPIGWHGCGAAHVAVAREAMRHGYPWVLIVEDDCVLAPDFAQRWPAIKEALAADNWDIFLGGPTYVQGPVTLRTPLIEIDRGFALHFYVLKACAFEKALAWNPDRHGPIDVYYSDQYRKVTTYPFLASQRPSLSDIKEVTVDYSDEFNSANDAMVQALYSLRTRQGTIVLVAASLLILWLMRRA